MSEDTSDLEKKSSELYRALREEWEQRENCCGEKVYPVEGMLEDLIKWSGNEHLLEDKED